MIRPEVFDVIKVNIIAWGTVGFTQSGVLQMAEIVQAVATVALILVSLVYTMVKLHRAIREMQWETEDRKNGDR